MAGGHSAEKDATSDDCDWKDLFVEFKAAVESHTGKTYETWTAIKYTS